MLKCLACKQQQRLVQAQCNQQVQLAAIPISPYCHAPFLLVTPVFCFGWLAAWLVCRLAGVFGVRWSTKKSGGSSSNGRDSQSKRLGVKKFGG